MVQSHDTCDVKAVINDMTLDHKAAYLNAEKQGPPAEIMLNSEITDILCEIYPSNRQYKLCSGWITAQLKEALYGCIESALLRYKEPKSTSSWMIFTDDLYDICSFTGSRRNGEGGRGEDWRGIKSLNTSPTCTSHQMLLQHKMILRTAEFYPTHPPSLLFFVPRTLTPASPLTFTSSYLTSRHRSLPLTIPPSLPPSIPTRPRE